MQNKNINGMTPKEVIEASDDPEFRRNNPDWMYHTGRYYSPWLHIKNRIGD